MPFPPCPFGTHRRMLPSSPPTETRCLMWSLLSSASIPGRRRINTWDPQGWHASPTQVLNSTLTHPSVTSLIRGSFPLTQIWLDSSVPHVPRPYALGCPRPCSRVGLAPSYYTKRTGVPMSISHPDAVEEVEAITLEDECVGREPGTLGRKVADSREHGNDPVRTAQKLHLMPMFVRCSVAPQL